MPREAYRASTESYWKLLAIFVLAAAAYELGSLLLLTIVYFGERTVSVSQRSWCVFRVVIGRYISTWSPLNVW